MTEEHKNKELWMVRHTDVARPDDYDFDLSRQGKRHARRLGWFLAEQNLPLPVVFIHFDNQRGETMAQCLSEDLEKRNPEAKIGIAKLPNMGLREGWASLLIITSTIDELAEQIGGQIPQTAIYVTHRLYNVEFYILRHLLATKTSPNQPPEEFAAHIRRTRRAMSDAFHSFDSGEMVGMRLPISTWSQIDLGVAEIIAQVTPKAIRPAYKTWHQRQRSLTPG